MSEPASPAPVTSAPPATDDLRSKAIRGSAWAFAGFAASQLLRLGGNMLLSRLLFPGAFGVMTLMTLLLMGIQMLTDVGFGQCVVQHPRGTEARFQNTVWTMQIIRGLVGFLVLCSISWIVYLVYGNPTYQGIPRFVTYIPLVALTGLISSFDSTRIFLANRTMAIRRLVALDFVAQSVGLAVMLVWAKLQPSLFALVVGEIVRATTRSIASHFVLPGHNSRFAWDQEAVSYVLRFGKWVAASSATTFVAMQSDRFILAKLFPMDVVGVYGIALMLANLPATVLSRLGVSLLYPALAERRRLDPASFGSALIRLRGSLLPLTLAISVAIVTLSPTLFRFCYDARYHAASWICPALAPYIWFSALQASCDRALLALEKSRALAVSRIVNFVATVIGCFVGWSLGDLPGLVIGVTFSNLLGHMVVQVSLAQSGIPIYRQDLMYTAAAVVLGGGGWVSQRYLMRDAHDLLAAAVRVPLLALVPAAIALLALRRIRGQFNRRSSAPPGPPPDQPAGRAA